MEVMVNGLPGKMATEVANKLFADPRAQSNIGPWDMNLVPSSLSGHNTMDTLVMEGIPPYPIGLVKPHEREKRIKGIINSYDSFISVDYTNPDAVNSNADFYCRHNLPFVMGTTGGDRTALEERVKDSDIVAVIAPNMAKQIVAFQAMMQYAAENFQDAFKEYTLEIVESHQKGKADTSGTAKAMVGYFNALGIPFTQEQIVRVRDPEQQLKMGIPKDALDGHGWHTYRLRSEDGKVLFEFTHNVNGRDMYALGTLDAVRFLHKQVSQGEKGKVYSMIDVLKGK